MVVRQLLVIFFAIISIAGAAADSSSVLEPECVTLCSTATDDYNPVVDCFNKFRSKSDSYLAVATCAFNKGDDSAAEKYALKAAGAQHEWMTFLRRIPGIASRWRTGGLGETYTLAYVASGGARHEDRALQYLRTSGQCQSAGDAELCAEQYFMSVVQRYEQRNIVSARTTGDPSAYALTGRVTDRFDKPIKNAKVTFICGKTFTTYTDSDGRYKVQGDKSLTAADLCTEGKLYVKFQYHDSANRAKIYFRILFNNQPIWVMKRVRLRSAADLSQDFKISEGLAPADHQAFPNLNDIQHYAVMHVHMAEVLEFYKDFLRVNIDYKLPVDVYPAQAGGKTYYDPTDSDIVIAATDTVYTDSDRPMNREWHEFSHHAMFSMYGKWPAQPANATLPRRNHDGFMNPTTSDSFMEGFAEFMSTVIAEHYRYPNPEGYASFGSLDRDIKAFHKRGLYEELALAAILLDLNDPKDDDKVDLTFDQIWSILKVYRADFTEINKALMAQFPDQKANIDEILVQHGFWKDKTRGDGIRQAQYEPYREKDGVAGFSAGDVFVDYASEPGLGKPWFIKQDNEEVGAPSNYQRPQRTNTVTAPWEYVKTSSTYPSFTMKVELQDSSFEVLTDNDGGMIHLPIPVEDSGWTIILAPASGQGKPFTLKSSGYDEEKAMEDGFIASHDFGVSGGPLVQTQKGDFTPYWEDFEIQAKPSDYEYSFREDLLDWEKGIAIENIKQAGSLWPWILGLAIVAVAVLLFLFKRPKRRKRK